MTETTPGPADPTAASPENPLLIPSSLPYQFPDFAALDDEHYLPAFRAGIRQHRAELEAIATQAAPPSFENTIVALEASGQLLRRVSMTFFNVHPADGTEPRQRIDEEIQPELASHEDALYLHPQLFERVFAVELEALTGEDRRLAEEMRREFTLRGAALDEEAKRRLEQINERLAVLSAHYTRRMVAENTESAVHFGTAEELAGLSAHDTDGAAEAAHQAGHDGGYLLALSMFTSQPWLARLEVRESRRRVFEAAWARGTTPGENYSLELAVEQAALRAEKAALFGFGSWAEYALQDRTAPDLRSVRDLLGRIIPPAVQNARRERAELEAVAGHEIEPWDWPYYSARVERQRYQLDAEALRPYFELDRTLRDGMFAAATALYGLSFTERTDLVGYHPDVRVWEVFDVDGSGLGLFLGDFYARPTKSGGAWMNSLREASTHLDERPVVTNTLNIPEPGVGEPTLLSLDHVTTLFHEFGHALHGLLSSGRYASLSGTAVPRDFVEFPSQVNEMWIRWPEVVAGYAVHVESGKPLDPSVLEALEASALWGEGFRTVEYLGATMLDLAWHSLADGERVEDPVTFEAEHLAAAGLDPALVPPRYRSSYFKHIFAGGYAAGYYSYLWSEVLDADTVEWFKEHGGLRRTNGDHFRAELLSRGNTRDPLASYRAFRGRDAELEPLLKRRGLLDEGLLDEAD